MKIKMLDDAPALFLTAVATFVIACHYFGRSTENVDVGAIGLLFAAVWALLAMRAEIRGSRR